MPRSLSMMLAIALCLGFASTPQTLRADDAEKKAVLERIKARIPEIKEYKTAQKIGEGWNGLIDSVRKEYLQDEKDKRLPKLIADENTDRTRFFQIIAAEEKTTSELVAKKWAERAFEHAKAGEWLKMIGEDKKEFWVQKKKKEE